MHRQTGDLVNPGLTKETQPIYLWLVENVSTETAVNVMFQYQPSLPVRGGRFWDIDRHHHHGGDPRRERVGGNRRVPKTDPD